MFLKVSIKAGICFRKIPDSFISIKQEATHVLLSVFESNEKKRLSLNVTSDNVRTNSRITIDSSKNNKRNIEDKEMQGKNNQEVEFNAVLFLNSLNDQRRELSSERKSEFDDLW